MPLCSYGLLWWAVKIQLTNCFLSYIMKSVAAYTFSPAAFTELQFSFHHQGCAPNIIHLKAPLTLHFRQGEVDTSSGSIRLCHCLRCTTAKWSRGTGCPSTAALNEPSPCSAILQPPPPGERTKPPGVHATVGIRVGAGRAPLSLSRYSTPTPRRVAAWVPVAAGSMPVAASS
jgi:hypothetical protein